MAPTIFLLLLLLLQTLLLTPTTTNPINKYPPQNRTHFAKTPTHSNPSSILAAAPPYLHYLSLKTSKVLIFGTNSSLSSPNNTFSLRFFPSSSAAGKPNGYLGMWYSLLPVPTCVWVANREQPISNLTAATLDISGSGRLVVRESNGSVLWSTANEDVGEIVELWENGNLVLLTGGGTVAWQSFDHPTDTWLPGMNLTKDRALTSWRSYGDPSSGFYSLRMRPSEYGEFELVYNGSVVYWRTGKWTGNAFTNVPEMLVPYIYKFHFTDPYKPTASFGFTERPMDGGPPPPLTRFHVDVSGQLQQSTWATQYWDVFWSQPDNMCNVFGLCGGLGVCNGEPLDMPRCKCLSGFVPQDESSWNIGDYSGGCCRLVNDSMVCDGKGDDGFEKVGVVRYEGYEGVSYEASRVKTYRTDWDDCQMFCLDTCDCSGVKYDGNSSECKVYFGPITNLKNLSSDSVAGDVFYLRVQKGWRKKIEIMKPLSPVVLSASIVGSIAVLGFVVVLVVVLSRRRKKRKGRKDEVVQLQLTSNMKVFSYKELHTATRGFSDKLGHGGFGAVFHGELSDSTIVAVKRLDRPGGGEREFQAEVCTIGNIQHVNLVRLRGFCSENSHRLLVYDYMPNGALSVYLRRDGPNLSWDVRFRLAVSMARGITYLHEGCRDCIIHCDIKPENILLDSDYTAKVSDFGLAKLLGRDFSRVLATMRGTWGYVAPEWISGVAITTKADVYSYGMTLIELLGGRRNVEARRSVGGREGGNETTNSWFFPPWAAQQIIEGNVRAVLDDRLGSTYNIEEAERVALVAVWCIQDSEAMRPTMGMVVKMLEGLVEVTVPPAPKLLQALVSGESFCGIKADSGIGLSNGSDFSGYNTRLSSCGSESSIGNVSSIVNEIVQDK